LADRHAGEERRQRGLNIVGPRVQVRPIDGMLDRYMSIDIGAKAVSAPSIRTSRHGVAAGVGCALSVMGRFYACFPQG
jgi:hypothetical protein